MIPLKIQRDGALAPASYRAEWEMYTVPFNDGEDDEEDGYPAYLEEWDED